MPREVARPIEPCHFLVFLMLTVARMPVFNEDGFCNHHTYP